MTATPAVNDALVLCALEPVAGRAVQDLMSFSGNTLEIVDGERFAGRTFGDLSKIFTHACVVGLVRPARGATADGDGDAALAVGDGMRDGVLIAPPSEALVMASDKVLTIAEQRDALRVNFDAPPLDLSAADSSTTTTTTTTTTRDPARF